MPQRQLPAQRRAALALAALDFRVFDTGGGCQAYARKLAGRWAMVSVAGDCTLPTRLHGEPIAVGVYDEESAGLTLEFRDLATWLFAANDRTAFEAWRDAIAAIDHTRVVVAPEAVVQLLAARRAPLALVAAADRAARAGDVAQLYVDRPARLMLLGLFGASVAGLDLSAFGFWLGPGTWACVL